eukprot:CAMPEP_0113659026 /NCGR_PEP_ID=MMETSP0017_2-20120614/32098_1 /TAXON_ID=2856 /ORGANISM="Cylindrotheca closterium" /LENGTH=748 /DNA_ID=CAMNT_0000573469 /DNA_START=92 /DNA_END=2338 /DNA_ORIENTATION=- /assembly_acc=CAM_ASM_000147
MITYGGGAFGFEVLFRLHGSAIFKSLTLAVLSCGVYLLLYFYTDIGDTINRADPNEELLFDHPYPIGALVSAFSFLLVFRANFAYHRYWEAFTAIHQMHSKWLDFATEVAAFHYQSERYKAYAPPAFGTYGPMTSPIVMNWSDPENIGILPSTVASSAAFSVATSTHMMAVSRERERLEEPMTKEELENHLEEMADQATINGGATVASSLRSRLTRRKQRNKKKNKKKPSDDDEPEPSRRSRMPKRKSERTKIINQRNNSKSINNLRIDDDDCHGGVNNQHSSGRRRHKSGLFGTNDRHHKSSTRQPTLYNEYHLSHGTNNSNFTAVARKTWREGVQVKQQQQQQQKPPAEGNDNDEPMSSNSPSNRTTNKPPIITSMPPNALFLEEIAHLLSLLSAVAMSTLRNDLENAESPLIEFFPNEPWPHVDPDDYLADVRQEWESSSSNLFTSSSNWKIGLPSSIRYMLGLSRNDVSRTLYNAARPFRVIGNVSDAEIALLQSARGPLAKVSLCSLWLQEFTSREYLQGSTGKVAPPIISRLYQYVSEGMAGYNQARKIAYIPFPFPHAQITTLFVLVIVAFMPLLMLTFVHNLILGLLLNLFTVLCFVGLHEVARELENPFQNVPNDLPLNNYQAQFNESLMVMFYGYHPDGHNWLPPPQQEQQEDGAEDDSRQVLGDGKASQTGGGSMDVELGAGAAASAAIETARSPHGGSSRHVKKLTPFNIPQIVLEEDEVGDQSVLSWESDVIPML